VFEKPVTYNADYDITHAFARDPDGHLDRDPTLRVGRVAGRGCAKI
jgi:hypothetical protein